MINFVIPNHFNAILLFFSFPKENASKQRCEGEIAALQQKYNDSQEDIANHKEQLVKMEMELSLSNQRLHDSKLLEKDSQILKKQIKEMSCQFEHVMDSQKMVNEEQSSLINQMQSRSYSKADNHDETVNIVTTNKDAVLINEKELLVEEPGVKDKEMYPTR